MLQFADATRRKTDQELTVPLSCFGRMACFSCDVCRTVCTVLYCFVLFCTVLCCLILSCTVLCCFVLFCTVLYCFVPVLYLFHFFLRYSSTHMVSRSPSCDHRVVFWRCVNVRTTATTTATVSCETAPRRVPRNPIPDSWACSRSRRSCTSPRPWRKGMGAATRRTSLST